MAALRPGARAKTTPHPLNPDREPHPSCNIERIFSLLHLWEFMGEGLGERVKPATRDEICSVVAAGVSVCLVQRFRDKRDPTGAEAQGLAFNLKPAPTTGVPPETDPAFRE